MKTFDLAPVSAADDSRLTRALTNDIIIMNDSASITGNGQQSGTFTINNFKMIVCGRLCVIDSLSVSYVSASRSIILQIDTTQTNTSSGDVVSGNYEFTNNQISLVTNTNTNPSLTQNDINNSSGIYQVVLFTRINATSNFVFNQNLLNNNFASTGTSGYLMLTALPVVQTTALQNFSFASEVLTFRSTAGQVNQENMRSADMTIFDGSINDIRFICNRSGFYRGTFHITNGVEANPRNEYVTFRLALLEFSATTANTLASVPSSNFIKSIPIFEYSYNFNMNRVNNNSCVRNIYLQEGNVYFIVQQRIVSTSLQTVYPVSFARFVIERM